MLKIDFNSGAPTVKISTSVSDIMPVILKKTVSIPHAFGRNDWIGAFWFFKSHGSALTVLQQL